MTAAMIATQTDPFRPFHRALIVDDHPLFCDALAITLKAVAGIVAVDTADRLETALHRLGLTPAPDVVVLDLDLPDVTGFDGLIRLRAVAGDIPVVVVSSMADDAVVSAVLAAGAAGFVPKHSRREVFRAAFESLSRGQVFVPEGYAPNAVQSSGKREDALHRLSLLTKQQARILQLICEGRLNKQIAFDLSIAETTVKAHVTAIMRKLGVQSRTQAVLIAKEASFSGILPDTDV